MTSIFLSTLPRSFWIESASPPGRSWMKLLDLALDSLEEDYPAVKHLVLRPGRGGQSGSLPVYPAREVRNARLILPLEAVEAIEWGTGRIRVREQDAFKAVIEGAQGQEVLLKRDILDNFIIDLQNARVTRANDLALDDEDGLRLRAADTSLRALLRRASGGWYHGFRQNELQ